MRHLAILRILRSPFSPRPVLSSAFLQLAVLCLLTGAHAALPQRFHQEAENEPLGGLLGSEIGDIVWSGRYLWVATENGLARLDPSRASGLEDSDWVTFTEGNGLGRGSVSALDAAGDTVWAATLFDTTIAGLGDFQVGGGLSFSTDAGRTWQHISNNAIFDTSKPDFDEGPSTPIQNPCYGVSITGNTIWAAFWAGSTVRSPDGGRTWERLLPDGADQRVFQTTDNGADSLQVLADSLSGAGGDDAEIARLQAGVDSLRNQHFRHNTFEVLAYGDTVWVGTSAGLTRSFDNGRTWKIIQARRGPDGAPLPGTIGGNWVVAIERQLRSGGSTVWVGARPAVSGETNSIAFSRDSGATWTATDSTSAWGFGFTSDRIWAAGDNGLYASSDGIGWKQVEVQDFFIADSLRGTFVDLETVGDALWVGAENGLGRTDDEGQTWRIIKSPVKTLSLDSSEVIGESGLVDSVRTYAAPNPFNPGRAERTRIQYSLSQDARVSVRIYDFASRLVRTLIEDEARQGGENHGINWDGLDEDGDSVANGVYFYRIELDTGQQAFGKVVVLD